MKRTVVGVALGLAIVAGGASAQSVAPTKPFSFGVAGGLSVPTGDFGKGVKSGFNVSALGEYQLPEKPIALRLEGQWQKFDVKGGGADVKTLGALANVVYYFPSASLVKPYVTGGVGMVNYKLSSSGASASVTKFAYDAGAGLQFQLTGVSTFVEANWQGIQTDGGATNQIPVRFGVRF